MVDFGDPTGLFLSQNMHLYADADTSDSDLPATLTAAKTAADDRFMSMKVTDFSKIHPMYRVNHGQLADYGHATPDINVTAIFSASPDVVSKLNDLNTQNHVGVLPKRVWRFFGFTSMRRRARRRTKKI